MRLKHMLPRPRAPATPAEIERARRRTLSLSFWDGAMWSIMTGMGDMYIAPFAVFLKAGNQALALIGTMPTLLGAVAQLVGAYATDRLRLRRGLLAPVCAIQALFFLPLFLVPLLMPGWAVPGVLLFTALGLFCGNAVAPAWISLMGDVAPEAARGDYFGRRSRLVILVVFLSMLAAGGILALFQRVHHVGWGFAVLFSIACCARLASAWLLGLHHDPPYHPTPDSYFSFWDFIRRMPRSNYARFALFYACMMGSICVASPFFTVYMLRDLHWSYAKFTLNSAAFQATQFLLIRWWGRIGDRHGNRVVIVTTSFMLPILPCLWTLSSNYYYLLLVQCVSGVCWSGFTLAAQNFTFDAVSPLKRARITSYSTLLNGIFTVLGGTLLGAWLANHLPATYHIGPWTLAFASSLPAVFLLSGLCRLSTALLLLPRFKEVRYAEPIHPAAVLLQLPVFDWLLRLAARAGRGRN